MRNEHESSLIISNLFNTDFLNRPFIRQTVMIPWFYLEAHVGHGKERAGEMFMVSSFDALKDILEMQAETFKIHSIQYVTPGFLNETGQWRMEPLLEASEAINQNGERVSLFQVHERTYSQFGVNTEANIQKVKILFPVGKGPFI